MQGNVPSSDPSRVAQIGNRENGQEAADQTNASLTPAAESAITEMFDKAPPELQAKIRHLSELSNQPDQPQEDWQLGHDLMDEIMRDLHAIDPQGAAALHYQCMVSATQQTEPAQPDDSEEESYNPGPPFNWTPEMLKEVYKESGDDSPIPVNDLDLEEMYDTSKPDQRSLQFLPDICLEKGSMTGCNTGYGKHVYFMCENEKEISTDLLVDNLMTFALFAAAAHCGPKKDTINYLLDRLAKVTKCVESEYEADKQAELGCALLEAEGIEYDEADKICDALDEELANAVTDREKYGALRFIKNQVKRTGYSSSSIYKAMKAGIIPDELVVRKTRHCKKLRLRDNFERYMVDAGIRRRRKGWTRKVSK